MGTAIARGFSYFQAVGFYLWCLWQRWGHYKPNLQEFYPRFVLSISWPILVHFAWPGACFNCMTEGYVMICLKTHENRGLPVLHPSFKIAATISSWYDRFNECLKTRWMPTSQACQTPVHPPGMKSTRMFGWCTFIQARNSFDRCTDQTSICQRDFWLSGRFNLFFCSDRYGTRIFSTKECIVSCVDQ